jgi:membrane protein YqaA with SNARE-associated domain
MELLAGYAGLLGAAFLAATILPFQSEVLLAGMLLVGHHDAGALVLVASIGNTLGSCVNWLLGRLLARLEDRRWFPVERSRIARAERWYHRYGRWSLLLSWLPIIGDALTIVAGVLREPFFIFLTLVALAKTARYIGVAAVTLG